MDPLGLLVLREQRERVAQLDQPAVLDLPEQQVQPDQQEVLDAATAAFDLCLRHIHAACKYRSGAFHLHAVLVSGRKFWLGWRHEY